MLRIDPCPTPSDDLRLRLSGYLTGPWVQELDAACRRRPGQSSVHALDLTEVVFADLAGLKLLRRLRRAGLRLEGLSPFLAAQLATKATTPKG